MVWRVELARRTVAVRRFGVTDGWPLVWHHGGLSCSLDATLLDQAAHRWGAAIYAIDRPGIGHTDWWDVPHSRPLGRDRRSRR